MKALMTLAALLLAPMAHAALFDPTLVRSSATAISAISVSSSVATQIDTAPRLLADRFYMTVCDEGADSIRCGYSSAVTQTTGGFLIRTTACKTLMVVPSIHLWCMATGSSAMLASLEQGSN